VEIAWGIAKLKKAKGAGDSRFETRLAQLEAEFGQAMDSDLNAPGAIAAIEKFLAACEKPGLSEKQASQALALLRKLDGALACLPL